LNGTIITRKPKACYEDTTPTIILEAKTTTNCRSIVAKEGAFWVGKN